MEKARNTNTRGLADLILGDAGRETFLQNLEAGWMEGEGVSILVAGLLDFWSGTLES